MARVKRQEGKRKEQHGDNVARQIFTVTLSPAAFRDPSIALSCRVRARERATKKDQGRFIRPRAARARILRVGAYQASCGGQKNPPSSNLDLAPCSSITNHCLRVYKRTGARAGTRCGMHP